MKPTLEEAFEKVIIEYAPDCQELAKALVPLAVSAVLQGTDGNEDGKLLAIDIFMLSIDEEFNFLFPAKNKKPDFTN